MMNVIVIVYNQFLVFIGAEQSPGIEPPQFSSEKQQRHKPFIDEMFISKCDI